MIGLTTAQAKEALKKYGQNLLPQKANYTVLEIFLSQVKNPFSFILIIAAALSVIVGDLMDGLLIGSILILNTVLGFWQEFKASKELEALRSLEVLYSRVYRDGKQVQILSSEIVPQDVVILEPGDKIPADGVVFESYSLQINESILTGESLPVIKTTKNLENQLFFGTTVISGRGKLLVLKTGQNTRFGGIAQTLTKVEQEPTPLEQALSKFIKSISIIVFVIIFLMLILRLSQGFEFLEALLISIALMVAAVPEGLPAVVTIVLAMGVHKMYQKNALVRKMVAVESLGATTVILSDKTGTLTKNEMRVQEVWSHPSGKTPGVESHLTPGVSAEELVKCAVLCNSASLVIKEDKQESYDILGDTTEGALLIWAKELGKNIEELKAEGKLIEEIPFSLESRKMTVVWQFDRKKVEYTKGAPEVIFPDVTLTKSQLNFWEKTYKDMASKGLRVLAFSKGDIFLGIIGIADQIRDEAKEAVKICKQAGIKVVMVTGDNELTAKTVAEKIGLLDKGDEVLTGQQLNELDDEDLKTRLLNIGVFARITPENKRRLVLAYQSIGEIVAVTGDGVNDSLALKQAQVGVAMGKTGTDVAKEASDLVLLDDNFATLVTAVEQGRSLYDNILKVIKFLMTGNFSEILLLSVASLFAFPTPLLPTQILWINFVTDGLPALALGFDSPSSNIMRIPPRKSSDILSPSLIKYMLTGGIIISLICFLIFWYALKNLGLQNARAATFTAMVVLQMMLPFIMRKHHSITSNKKLLFSVLLMLFLQFLILTIPSLRRIFGI